jgi:hypothetical protein
VEFTAYLPAELEDGVDGAVNPTLRLRPDGTRRMPAAAILGLVAATVKKLKWYRNRWPMRRSDGEPEISNALPCYNTLPSCLSQRMPSDEIEDS